MRKKNTNEQLHTQPQFRLKPVYAAVLLAFTVQTVQANPMDATVVSGQASFVTAGSTLTVTNTPGAIINWQGFSISANEITRFAQQSASSAVLNRVVSNNNPSSILGTLQSNGRVFLINPNGIVFGAGATVDVAGLVASTLNLSNADFLAGRYSFTEVPGAQKISNAGNITSQGDGLHGGQIYLIAPDVENTGVITAPNGEILLAAGHSVDLVNTNSPNLIVNITAPAGDATNVGQLIAQSGSLGLFGTVVRNSGQVSADSATLQGGRIVFKASQRAEVGGTVSATGTTGGTIEALSSNEVQITAGAALDASGSNGGGTVLVGGDQQGANPNVPNAQNTYVDATATIKVDATQNGDGGKVIVWADDVTRAYGSISAQGGANGGNGGFVETSAHYLDVAGIRVDASARHGDAGMWLLDPADVTIDVTTPSGGTFSGNTWVPSAATSFVNNGTIATILNGGTSVTITVGVGVISGSGDIKVNTSITQTGLTNSTLILQADNNILIRPGISISSTGGGALNVVLNADNDGAGGGGIYLDAGSSIISNGGNITLGGGLAGDGTGFAIGNGTSTGGKIFNSGIYVLGDITAGAGNVTMRGEGANNNLADGITFAGGTLSSNGIVNINGIAHGYSNGTGDLDNQFGAGVDFYNAGIRLTTQTGTVTITGTNDAPNADPTFYRAGGIMVETGTVIETTGTGTLTLNGTTSSFNTSWGVGVLGGTIQTTAAGGGAITLTGFNTSGLPDGGVTIMNGNVLSNGGGINMLGQGLGGAVGVVGTSIIGGASSGNISIVGMDAGPVAIGAGTILNAGNGNLSITSLSDINVDSTIQHGATPAAMSLQAGNNINFGVGAGVNSTGALNVMLRSDSDANNTGTVTFGGTNAFSLSGGRVDLYYNPTAYITPTNYSGTFVTTPFAAWMLVNNATNLQDMGTNLSGNYALGKNIDATGTSTWNLGAGFVPVGTISTPFTGTFDGQAHTINGLFINRPTTDYVGLFGRTNASTIKNVSLTNVNISGNSYVGSLAGWHQGTLAFSSNASGSVTGTMDASSLSGNSIGGLVGMNYNLSLINNCSAGSTVSGDNYVGGLAGSTQRSTISNSSASGTVTGTQSYAGGLVGESYDSFINFGTASGNVNGVSYVGGLEGRNGYSSNVSNSSSSGNVSGTNDVGGLVGFNAFGIDTSFATGSVSGTTNVGGLVGNNEWVYGTTFGVYTVGAISNSYAATGTVTGVSNVGGLVGRNTTTSNTINTSNASGNVTGNSGVGGLVGFSNGSISNSNASGSVTGSGTSITNLGGLVGFSAGGFGTNISNSFATGASVAGVGASNVGGLVGLSYTDITNSYASGVSVSGGNAIGGLVGSSSVTISGSYVSVGAVTGTSNVGGLVGNNSGNLVNSHYNINGVTINSANKVTLGGLYNDNNVNAQVIGQYADWLLDKALNIADYATPFGSFGIAATNSYTISNIQGMKDLLGFADNYLYTFTLTGSIDLSPLPGFYVPEFAGTFNGAGNKISKLNLTILNSNLGLFGRNSGTVSNVVLEDAAVTGSNNVGALAGWNQGTINNSSVSASSTGGVILSGADFVGGMVGNNAGSITNGSVNGSIGPVSVTGVNSVGGLAGTNSSSISTSFATGVTVAGASNVGGLVGNNVYLGVISDSYVSSGAVSATVHNVGGLVGFENGGMRNNSHFNIDAVTTNGGNNVTVAGLYASQFNDWLSVGTPLTPLVITDYSASLVLQGDGSYGIGNMQGMKDMLGFAGDPAAYNFSLTATNINLDPGYYVPKLVGSFSGKTFTLSNLSLTLPNYDMGLFGVTSTSSLVSNLNLVNVRVNGYGNVGGLVGSNFGNIDNVTVGVNAVNGISSVAGSAGGLVGSNNGGSYPTGTGTTYQQIFTGSISNSYVTGGTVSSGNNDVGGLVGHNSAGNITASHVANTAVSGSSNVGGLVGNNQGLTSWSVGAVGGNIINSYVANGTVTSTGNALSISIGGLVGLNFHGDISGSHVLSPTVNGGSASMVGGLVGQNMGGFHSVYQGPSLPSLAVYFGAISNSYVSGGTVSSTGNDVGGLAGNNYGGLIDLSYVDTVSVTGGMNAGGLVGNDSGEGAGCCTTSEMGVVRNSYALNTQVTGGSHVGGLIGLVGLSGTWTSGPVSYDAVFNSYVSGGTVASNAVTSSANAIGGLVGYNSLGNISNSYVTNGTVVTGGLASDVGGLVGHNIGSGSSAIGHGFILASYVNGGTVSGNSNVGGLVGNNSIIGLSGSGLVGSSHVLGTTVNGSWSVGGLVGLNEGNISGSHANNSLIVATTSSSSAYAGGLVGYNAGSISNSYVSGGTVSAVNNASDIGGLVGHNNITGTISNSYVSGASMSGNNSVGGLVGHNVGNITNSYISGGTVSGNASNIGGLVGLNVGSISNSYVSGGAVTAALTDGSGAVGGLVGANSGIISNTYASGGTVDGAGVWTIGGLVGANNIGGDISNSYAANTVLSLYSYGGGVLGQNDGLISSSVWDSTMFTGIGIYGSGSGTATNVVGLATADFFTKANFTSLTLANGNINPGFDFINTWWMDDGNTRPFLQMEYSTNIVNSHQLQLMGMDAASLAASYTLANNIDLAPALAAGGMWNVANGFVPMGDITTPFIGQFDGQNFNISNLKISGAVSQVGLFGVVDVGASISNVGLVDPQVSGSWSVGALVGGNRGAVTNSYVINGIISGALSSGVGGLVGHNSGTINSSYVSGGSVSGGSWTAGGLAGTNSISGTISQSYASSGLVTGGAGLTGALVGVNDGGIINSYWNSAIATGIGMNAGTSNAAGLSAAQMQQQSSFAGWDFTTVWRSYNGHSAPLLKSFLKPVTVTASGISGNFTKTFDGVAWNSPALGTITYSNPAATGLLNEVTPFGAPVTNAGSYEMFWSGQQGYDISYTAGGMLTINPAGVTLMSITANDANKTYGSTLNFLGTEFTPVGLVGSDAISSVTLTSAGAVNTANAGTYAIAVTPGSEVFSVGSASNYSITYADGVLTVNPATLTYTANAAGRQYGATDPAFSGGVTGFVLGESLATATTGSASFTTNAVNTSNVGSYSITGSGLAANNGNYVFTQDAGNSTAFSITARPVNVTANAISRVYGDADPALTYTVGGLGLTSWDTNATAFTGALARAAGENVAASPYAISQGTLTATNYTITFAGNFFSITPAPLSVYAYPTNKIISTPDPLLGYMVSGLKLGDTAAATLNSGSLARDPGEAVGNYQINQGSLALASSNYTMSYFPANFTILAPTVVDEIANAILLLGTPETGSAQSTSSSEEEEKRKAEEEVAAPETPASADTTGQPLPVCPGA